MSRSSFVGSAAAVVTVALYCAPLSASAGMSPVDGLTGMDSKAEADQAHRFVVSLGDECSIEVATAADLLCAIAVWFDAGNRTSIDDSLGPIILAAQMVGYYDALRYANSGDKRLFEAAALSAIRHKHAVASGTNSGDTRRAASAVWKSRALQEFEIAKKKNGRLTPEAWSERHASRFDMKPETVAKAINYLLRGN